MIEGKTVLITGGAGFIGTQLTRALSNPVLSNKIFIYDNLSRNAIKHTDLESADNVRLIKGDILDYSFLKATVSDISPDVVVHMAAVAGITTVKNKPVHTMEVIMLGTYHLLKAIVESGISVEQVIDFSTSEIFGSYAFKYDENASARIASVGDARWTYSTAKLAAEHLSHAFYTQYGINTTTVRPFNVYGPGQVGEGAMHAIVMRAIRGERIEIHGDGSQIRSWCYITDFIDCLKLIIGNRLTYGESFNIGNPVGTISIAMLAKVIKELSGSDSEIVFVPKPHADVELRVPSIEKAVRLLGYDPKVDVYEGIKRTIEWYKELCE